MAKGIFQDRPDYDSPEYKSFRYSVMILDKFECKKCGSKKGLQVHHIKRWADYPQLRYLRSNGITLCENCHALVNGKEERFEEEFRKIVEIRKNLSGQNHMKKKAKQYIRKYKPPNPYMRF